jgi:hypothetical protein
MRAVFRDRPGSVAHFPADRKYFKNDDANGKNHGNTQKTKFYVGMTSNNQELLKNYVALNQFSCRQTFSDI